MVHFTAYVGGVKSLRSVANTGVLCYNIRYQDGLRSSTQLTYTAKSKSNYIMQKDFYSRKDVTYRTTFSRSLIDTLEQQGDFPKRIAIRQNKIVWVAAEVDKWVEAKIDADR